MSVTTSSIESNLSSLGSTSRILCIVGVATLPIAAYMYLDTTSLQTKVSSACSYVKEIWSEAKEILYGWEGADEEDVTRELECDLEEEFDLVMSESKGLVEEGYSNSMRWLNALADPLVGGCPVLSFSPSLHRVAFDLAVSMLTGEPIHRLLPGCQFSCVPLLLALTDVARHVEYKDPKEEEWEKFQKAIMEETTVSAQIIAEDETEAAAERIIDEIDEQMVYWSRFIDLKNKQEQLTQIVNKKTGENGDDLSSSGDEIEFDDDIDWRAKRAYK